MAAVETNRTLKVGPFVSFRFESGVKQGNGLTATFTIDIDDPKRRDRELYRLAGIEESTYIALNQERIPGLPTEYDERTSPDGKTSSMHWVRFKFIPEQIEKFKMLSVEAVLGLAHPAYSHMAVILPDTRAELAKDFG
ncbi:MAG TPA: DUF3501 family protein [Rhizomicrobium sp.]|nr:DUF3501 family protein [Rhizomicrobium sp.]